MSSQEPEPTAPEPIPQRPIPAEPQLGGGFTLAVALAPVGFFGIYLLAVMLPGARTWLGAAMLSILAAASYIGLTMIGTRWFEKNRYN